MVVKKSFKNSMLIVSNKDTLMDTIIVSAYPPLYKGGYAQDTAGYLGIF